ncbi:MAG: hypothetical protein AB7O65_12270 [Candidatus Korobacteraceae bacterium]
MKLWKKVLLFNGAGLVGVASSLFVLPADTPFAIWLIGSSMASENKPGISSRVTTVITVTVGVYWVLNILLHVLYR